MSNPAPFNNIFSIKVSVEVTDEGTFAVDHSTGTKLPCCPTCHEPYMLVNNDRGCPNSHCPEHKKENWPYWAMTDMGPDLCDPFDDNRK